MYFFPFFFLLGFLSIGVGRSGFRMVGGWKGRGGVFILERKRKGKERKGKERGGVVVD